MVLDGSHAVVEVSEGFVVSVAAAFVDSSGSLVVVVAGFLDELPEVAGLALVLRSLGRLVNFLNLFKNEGSEELLDELF